MKFTSHITLQELEEDSFDGGTLIYVPVSREEFGNIFDSDFVDVIRRLNENGWRCFECEDLEGTKEFVEFFLEDILGMNEDDFSWSKDTTPEEKLLELWDFQTERIDPQTDEVYTQIHRIVIEGFWDAEKIKFPPRVPDHIVLCLIESREFEIEAKQVYVIA